MEHTYMTTHVDIRGRFLPASESLLVFTREKIIKWCEQRKVASDVWSWRSSVHGVPLHLYPYDFKIFTLFVWNRGARAPVYLCVWKSEGKIFSFSPSSWFMRQSLFLLFLGTWYKHQKSGFSCLNLSSCGGSVLGLGCTNPHLAFVTQALGFELMVAK